MLLISVPATFSIKYIGRFFVSIKIFAKYSPITPSDSSCTPDSRNNGITVDAQPGSAVLLNSLTYRDWETDRKSTRLNSSH